MNDKAKRLHYMYIQTPPLSRDPTTACSELLQQERSGCGLFTSLATRPSRISRHRVSGNHPFGVEYQGTSLSTLSAREPQWTTHSAGEGTRNGKEATFWNMTLVCYFPWFSQPDHWLWLKLRGEHVLFSRAWITSLLVSTCSMYISFTDIIFS